MYIIAASSISSQNSFQNKGFSAIPNGLKPSLNMIHPDYSTFISAMDRRRMSDVLKMAITCTYDCLEQAGIKQPDAIIVGTSMGCCSHTKSFLDKIIASNGGMLSPTSFISSLHNTIAGQISLLLGNYSYNMTHTQNSLSFEQALTDVVLCIKDSSNFVLVGGADEMEPELYDMSARLNCQFKESYGSSFFIISSQKKETNAIKLVDVASFGLIENISEYITLFLNSTQLKAENIDLVLYSNSNQSTIQELFKFFKPEQLFDFQIKSGTYYTNSAFAMNLATDILSFSNHPIFGKGIKNILICNNLIPENLGLILLESTNKS